MEGLVMFALGAAAVLVAQRGREPTKRVVGWVTRQTGWLSSRVRAEIDAARERERDGLRQGRSSNAAPSNGESK